MNRHNISIQILIPTAVLLLAGLLWAFVPNRRQTRLDSLCRVEATSYYVLPLAKGDTLYFPLGSDCFYPVSLHPDSVVTRVDLTAVFISREGHLLTTDSLVGRVPDTLAGADVRRRLSVADSFLIEARQHHRAVRQSLDEYARRHSVVDDGYNEVMAYRERIGRELRQLDSLCRRVQQGLQQPSREAYLRSWVRVRPAAHDTLCSAHRVVRRDGMLLLQLDGATLPAGSSRFTIYRLPTYVGNPQLYAYQDFGGPTATAQPQVLKATETAYPATEGGAWVNASGQLCGLQGGGQRIDGHRIARLVYDVHPLPVWAARNVCAWLQGWLRSATPRRPRSAFSVQRMLTVDSLLYEGQVVHAAGQRPLRQGWGRLYAPGDTVYEGEWQADTLVTGVRLTRQASYRGEFNARYQPSGMGVETKPWKEHYAGAWKDGQRSGHGFSARPGQLVRCGDWRHGNFRGERMVYTADRIYGIDISRYQHGKGKKKYAIDWKRLRITSLGAGRRVQGNVDYPVSFVYIKSTEGRTVLNPYYATDLRQARRHGIPVGTYHFFSLTSSGAQQAAHFLRRSSVRPHDLPPVLDLEPTDYQIRCAGGDSVMFAQVLVWLRTVEKRCGKRPVLYVGQNFVNHHLPHAPAALQKYDVWIARYGEFKPYVRLLHWQLTPYGRVRGIHGEVDINVFNGTREQFADYLTSVRK